MEKHIWTEKYRPQKIQDIVGDFKDKIIKHLEDNKSIPHMIFESSSPGTGKSTIAKAIINETGADALVLNSSDERGIDTVREKTKEFVSSRSSKPGIRRIVFLDEADALTSQAQDALRNMMETYSNNALFILTCNNVEKIITPIRSRCLEISLKYPSKPEIYKYLEKICQTQNMKYDEKGILALMNKHYPNIRNCVIALQDLYVEGLDVEEKNIKHVNETYEQIWKFIQEKKWTDIKQEIFKQNLDAREINTYVWNKILNDEFPNLKMLQVCCRNERDMAYGADPKIVFVTSLIELIK